MRWVITWVALQRLHTCISDSTGRQAEGANDQLQTQHCMPADVQAASSLGTRVP